MSLRVSKADSKEGYAPQQLMLRLRSLVSGAASLHVARSVEGASAGSFFISASSTDVARQIGTQVPHAALNGSSVVPHPTAVCHLSLEVHAWSLHQQY